jgi:phage gp37-like protein
MIDAILAAMVARIGALQGVDNPLGYDIPRVDTYDGQVNADKVAELLQKTPAVFAAFQRATPEDEGDDTRWDARFNLLVVTRNLATHQAAAHGGPGGTIGAHAIAQHLAGMLRGQKLGLAIDRIQVGAITTIVPGWLRGHKAALVGLELATAFRTAGEFIPPNDATEGDADAALAEFLRVETRLKLDATGAPYIDLTETRSA